MLIEDLGISVRGCRVAGWIGDITARTLLAQALRLGTVGRANSRLSCHRSADRPRRGIRDAVQARCLGWNRFARLTELIDRVEHAVAAATAQLRDQTS
jgi:hypothetical protein